MEIKKSIVIKNYLRDLNGYEVAKNYGNGILKIKKGNEYRIIDSDGEDVISTPLKDVVYDNGHFICTNIYGQTGVIDEYGQIIQGVCNCFYKIFDYSKNRILLYDDIDEKFAKLDLNSTHGIDSLDFYSAALRNDMIVGLSRRDGKDIFKTIGNKGNVKEYSFNKWPYNKNISYDILFDDGILVETNNNIFLLDNNGNEVNKVRKYGKLEEISCFNGKIILKKENKLFIVNEDGSKEKYVGCEYRIIDNVLIVYSNINEYEKKYIYTKNKEKYIFDYIKFNDSRYLNFTNGMKHGIFDTVNGKILVKDQDNYLNNVKNDICIIEENGLVGFKNLNTNFELKPKYKLTNDTYSANN